MVFDTCQPSCVLLWVRGQVVSYPYVLQVNEQNAGFGFILDARVLKILLGWEA